MMNDQTADIIIIGGGLAGLALSIQLGRSGHRVVLFEKEHYPFHKVCGEYISMESWAFVQELGLPLHEMNLPLINRLEVSSPDGTLLSHELDLGGFGISRFTLDKSLKQLALNAGVKVYDDCKVTDVVFIEDQFTVQTGAGIFSSSICCGSFGKKSNLDIKLKRPFADKTKGALENYIGVKYHIRCSHPPGIIALHNFEDGYCGISQVDEGKFCLCYLTTARNLKKNQNSIREMERTVLYKNSHLKKIFTEAEWLYDQPLTISQISFAKKSQVEDHILMLGDAAGMITPLCGNGMSMALHSSKLAAACIGQFLQKKISRLEMETLYSSTWKNHFARRLLAGRVIQTMFGKPAITNLFVKLVKKLPVVAGWLIRQTHGERF
jgi:flavin-dependent dehydrogenase